MIYCKECGEPLSDAGSACRSCGAETVASPKPSSTKKLFLSIGIIVCTVTVLCLTAIVVFPLILSRNTKGSNATKVVAGDTGLPDVNQDQIQGRPPGNSIHDELRALHKEMNSGAESIFGTDDHLNPDLQPNIIPTFARDVESNSRYNYSIMPTPLLFTDIMQLGGYSFQQELAKTTSISIEDENLLGDQAELLLAKERYKGKLNNNKELAAYVNELGLSLTTKCNRKGINYKFFIVDDKSFNAFAYPGGRIYVNTGLLDKLSNEAQLASVLAHEIKHVDLRHTIVLYQIVSRMTGDNDIGGFIMYMANLAQHPYRGREEADADRRGLELIYGFGYSPYQVVELWRSFATTRTSKVTDNPDLIDFAVEQTLREADNLLNTHPEHSKRYILLQNHTLKLMEKYPRERHYVGEWNFKNMVPKSRTIK